MTTYNKTTLKTFFENGDVPTGQNYSDFIDSCVNLVETAEQDMAGALYTTELISPRVSASNVNVTGILSAATLNGNNIMGTTVSAGSLFADSLTVATNISANAGTVYASAIRTSNGLFESNIAIISAAGSTQATATLITATINRLQGVVDGQTTGFILPAPQVGWATQVLVNETAVSANLWPAVGCAINGKSANTVFAMAANSTYYVTHTYVSGYGVK